MGGLEVLRKAMAHAITSAETQSRRKNHPTVMRQS